MQAALLPEMNASHVSGTYCVIVRIIWGAGLALAHQVLVHGDAGSR